MEERFDYIMGNHQHYAPPSPNNDCSAMMIKQSIIIKGQSEWSVDNRWLLSFSYLNHNYRNTIHPLWNSPYLVETISSSRPHFFNGIIIDDPFHTVFHPNWAKGNPLNGENRFDSTLRCWVLCLLEDDESSLTAYSSCLSRSDCHYNALSAYKWAQVLNEDHLLNQSCANPLIIIPS